MPPHTNTHLHTKGEEIHKADIQIEYLLVIYHKEISFKQVFGIHIIIPFDIVENKLHTNEMNVLVILYQELNPGQAFDTVAYRVSSTFFRIDPYFDFLFIKAETTTLHKYSVQNLQNLFRAISEMVEIFFLSPDNIHLIISSYET